MTYDFSQLNDKEFEIMVNDLLSAHMGKRIERFKPGKDLGVDGRFYVAGDGEGIVQSKHYLKTGYAGLISALKKEKIKVEKLDPSQYIVATSIPLSMANKQEIKKIFGKYINKCDHIYGQEDLNDLLSENKRIIDKHFKLWINSTDVLSRILHNAIKGRSAFEAEDIKDRSKKYVQTKNHDRAISVISDKNVIIITGEPGIGKTTLAENICLYYLSIGYVFVDIEDSISAAEAVYDTYDNEIFYFDDFLGSNYFEAIENKKDSHIVKFMNRISKDNRKKFILTSRTNILNSGMAYSDILSNSNIRDNEYVINVDDITRFEKASILYNHIWFSNLDESYIDELYKDKRYFDIISHKNFNPRLIQFITDSTRVSVSCDGYWEMVCHALDNPKVVWENCFVVQSDDFIRYIVMLVVFNGSSISEEDLKASFNNMVSLEKATSKSNVLKGFHHVVKLATKSFLNRDMSKIGVSYSLFNPSIADYVFSIYGDDFNTISRLYLSLMTLSSIRSLVDLNKSDHISDDMFNRVMEFLFYSDLNGVHGDYIILLCVNFMDDLGKRERIEGLLTNVVMRKNQISEIIFFLGMVDEINHDLITPNYIKHIISPRYLDDDELFTVIEFIGVHDLYSDELNSEMKIQIEGHLGGKIREIDIDLDEYILYSQEGDYTIDDDGVRDEIAEALEVEKTIFDDEMLVRFGVNIDDVAADADVEDMVSDYIKSSSYDVSREYHRFSEPSVDFGDIEDLFQRDSRG